MNLKLALLAYSFLHACSIVSAHRMCLLNKPENYVLTNL